jgi:ribonuclease-3
MSFKPPPPAYPPPHGHPIHPEFAKRTIAPDEFDDPPSTASGVPLDRHMIERMLGFPIVTFELYETAFTQKSAVGPNRPQSYERLEFVGDSVLNFVIAKFLYDSFPDKDEGFLTKLRTKLVSGKFLSMVAWRLGLHEFVIMNQKGLSRGWNANLSILEDVFEALIGALYLDLGIAVARDFIMAIVGTYADLNDILLDTNHKDRLVKHLNKMEMDPIAFETLHETGGANAAFLVSVSSGTRVLATGEGKTKKDAEQAASKNALTILGVPDELINNSQRKKRKKQI